MDDTTVPPETASPLPLSEQEAVASVPDPKPDLPWDAQRMSQSGGYVMAAFSGPIPDPHSLKIYGEIDPTYPERLLAMAERQEAHRQAEEIRQKELEKIAIESYIAFNQAKHNLARQKHLERIKYQTRGQWFGIVLVSFFLMGAIYVTMNGHDWVGGVIIAALAALLALFIQGRQASQSKSPPAQPPETPAQPQGS